MTRALRLARALTPMALALCMGACGTTEAPRSSGAGRSLLPGSLAVLASDYRSTNVALRDPAGVRLTPSILSTASASAGVSFALSGDVVLPSEPRGVGEELVLIDRYGTNVLTFVDTVSGRVRAQLPVGTGFESNPQDFLTLDAGRALVARFGVDPRPGDVALDGGDDVLVVDTETPALVRRVVLPRKEGTPARPGALTPFGGKVYVNLHRLAADFDRAVDADVAVLDGRTGELERVVALPGLRNCGKPVFSQDGLMATACSGLFDPARARFDDVGAAVVVGTLVDGAFRERERWSASAIGATPTGSVAWLGEGRIVASLFGSAGRGDAVVDLALGATAPREIHRSTSPFTLGAIRCSRGAAFLCAMPDASSSVIVGFSLGFSDAGAPTEVRAILAPDITGLPLRDLAFFR
jgi:hypothetical protein